VVEKKDKIRVNGKNKKIQIKNLDFQNVVTVDNGACFDVH
jgi:selenocysteine-specific translation elongation factor